MACIRATLAGSGNALQSHCQSAARAPPPDPSQLLSRRALGLFAATLSSGIALAAIPAEEAQARYVPLYGFKKPIKGIRDKLEQVADEIVKTKDKTVKTKDKIVKKAEASASSSKSSSPAPGVALPTISEPVSFTAPVQAGTVLALELLALLVASSIVSGLVSQPSSK